MNVWEKTNMKETHAPPRRPHTDLAQIFERVIRRTPGLTETAWAKKLGKKTLFADLRRKQRSKSLEQLDRMALAAGFEDFVEMASGVPRYDRALLQAATTAAFAARDLLPADTQLPPDTWAKIVVLIVDRIQREGAQWNSTSLTDMIAALIEYELERAGA